VGLSQLLCVDWLLAWHVVFSEARLSSSARPWGGGLVCAWWGGPFWFLSEATSGCAACVAP